MRGMTASLDCVAKSGDRASLRRVKPGVNSGNRR